VIKRGRADSASEQTVCEEHSADDGQLRSSVRDGKAAQGVKQHKGSREQIYEHDTRLVPGRRGWGGRHGACDVRFEIWQRGFGIHTI
jgi:hypothetical protein